MSIEEVFKAMLVFIEEIAQLRTKWELQKYKGMEATITQDVIERAVDLEAFARRTNDGHGGMEAWLRVQALYYEKESLDNDKDAIYSSYCTGKVVMILDVIDKLLGTGRAETVSRELSELYANEIRRKKDQHT